MGVVEERLAPLSVSLSFTMQLSLFLLLGFVAFASCTVYFQEDFNDPSWEDRWVYSTADDESGTAGKFKLTSGEWFNDAAKDQGIQTSEDARFYKISAKIPEPFSNEGKDLVIQYSVKNEQVIDCGGGYIKLHPSGIDQATLSGETEYNIMFGPDVCGGTNKRTHFIFHYKDDNHLIEKTVFPPSDQLTHLYTAIIHPDQTYELRIDGEVKESGTLEADWSMLPPQEIDDPEASKPEDWVDDAQIPDPSAVKPEGWDDIPAEIADPDAVKPEDWDDELDGEWEPPQVPNPDYVYDPNMYHFTHEYVSFEIWQVKSGTIFDNILITDSVEEAEAFSDGYFKELQEGEKAKFDEIEAERIALEEAEREAEMAAMEEEADDEEFDGEEFDDDGAETHDEL